MYKIMYKDLSEGEIEVASYMNLTCKEEASDTNHSKNKCSKLVACP